MKSVRLDQESNKQELIVTRIAFFFFTFLEKYKKTGKNVSKNKQSSP